MGLFLRCPVGVVIFPGSPGSQTPGRSRLAMRINGGTVSLLEGRRIRKTSSIEYSRVRQICRLARKFPTFRQVAPRSGLDDSLDAVLLLLLHCKDGSIVRLRDVSFDSTCPAQQGNERILAIGGVGRFERCMLGSEWENGLWRLSVE